MHSIPGGSTGDYQQEMPCDSGATTWWSQHLHSAYVASASAETSNAEAPAECVERTRETETQCCTYTRNSNSYKTRRHWQDT